MVLHLFYTSFGRAADRSPSATAKTPVPACSRLDRLLPIGPHPKRAHATPNNLRKVTHSVEAVCVAPARAARPQFCPWNAIVGLEDPSQMW